MSRVQLVDLPLSEYLHFEIQHGYRHTTKAGEEIYLLDRATTDKQHRFVEDFWLFDDNKVMVQIYNDAGTMQFSYLNEDPEIVERYVRIKDAALKIAEPVQSFYERDAGIFSLNGKRTARPFAAISNAAQDHQRAGEHATPYPTTGSVDSHL